MFIGRYKRIYKWNYGFEISLKSLDSYRLNPVIRLWYFKVHQLPDEGDILKEGRNYRGFNWNYRFFEHWNIIFYQKTFIVKNWQRKLFRLRYQVYKIVFPIKIIHYG